MGKVFNLSFEQGIPVEGYAREKCKKEADASATVKMKMYYPVND